MKFMFMGEYDHTLDPKGRMIVPAKFREELGDRFILTVAFLHIRRRNGSSL